MTSNAVTHQALGKGLFFNFGSLTKLISGEQRPPAQAHGSPGGSFLSARTNCGTPNSLFMKPCNTLPALLALYFQVCYLHTLDFHHPRKESLDSVSQPACRAVFCSVAQHFPKGTQDPLNKQRDNSIFCPAEGPPIHIPMSPPVLGKPEEQAKHPTGPVWLGQLAEA